MAFSRRTPFAGFLKHAGLRLRDIYARGHCRSSRTANIAAKARYLLSNPSVAAKAVGKFVMAPPCGPTTEPSINWPTLCGEKTRPQVSFLRFNHGRATTLALSRVPIICPHFEQLNCPVFVMRARGTSRAHMAARCEARGIEVLDKVTVPNSLGLFTIRHLPVHGFDLFGREYKVTGVLGAYGEIGSLRKVAKDWALMRTGLVSLSIRS